MTHTQLTVAERQLVDKVMRRKGGRPMDALKQVNDKRENNGVDPLDKSSLYRFLKGRTHARGRSEKRGRHKVMKKADLQKLEALRMGPAAPSARPSPARAP